MKKEAAKPATLKDVAQYVGVSINTVSCVLNPRRIKVQVSPQTRRAILEAARKLNYQRNIGASRLAGGQTRTIGILMDRITHAFDAPVTDAFEHEVVRLGYQCFIGCTRSDGLEKLNYIKRFLEHGVNGLLLTTVWDDPDVKQGLELVFSSNIPVVFVDFAWEKSPGPLICGNHVQGGRLLMRHLLDQGHRSFAFLAAQSEFSKISCMDRIRGLQSVLKEEDLDTASLKIYGIANEELAGTAFEGEILASYVIKRHQEPDPPTVVICLNDLIAFSLMTGLYEKGWRVPDDIAVTGYDDLNFSFLQTLGFKDQTPFPWVVPLTTIRQPFAEIGKTAARMLIGEIEGVEERKSEEHKLDVRLIVRESSRMPNRAGVLAAK